MSLTSRYQYKKFQSLPKSKHSNSIYERMMEIQKQSQTKSKTQKKYNNNQLLPPITNNSFSRPNSYLYTKYNEEEIQLKQKHPYLDALKPKQIHFKTNFREKSEQEVRISLQVSKIELKELFIEQLKTNKKNNNSYSFDNIEESKQNICGNLFNQSKQKKPYKSKLFNNKITDQYRDGFDFCGWPQNSTDDY